MIKQWSLLALAVCASISPVAFADSVTDLSLRVRDAIAFVDGVSPEQLEGSAGREVILPQRQGDPLHFTGQTFLGHTFFIGRREQSD